MHGSTEPTQEEGFSPWKEQLGGQATHLCRVDVCGELETLTPPLPCVTHCVGIRTEKWKGQRAAACSHRDFFWRYFN